MSKMLRIPASFPSANRLIAIAMTCPDLPVAGTPISALMGARERNARDHLFMLRDHVLHGRVHVWERSPRQGGPVLDGCPTPGERPEQPPTRATKSGAMISSMMSRFRSFPTCSSSLRVSALFSADTFGLLRTAQPRRATANTPTLEAFKVPSYQPNQTACCPLRLSSGRCRWVGALGSVPRAFGPHKAVLECAGGT
jgi:hypothetical protein